MNMPLPFFSQEHVSMTQHYYRGVVFNSVCQYNQVAFYVSLSVLCYFTINTELPPLHEIV